MSIHKLLPLSLIAVLGTSVGSVGLPTLFSASESPIASASASRPVQDSNGDYHFPNRNRPRTSWEWEVMDPDPNGLNCRYLNRAQGSPTGGSDIYNYPVSHTFEQGQRLISPQISYDDRDLPWLWIGASSTNHICFVRANSYFVRPVRPLN
ncbi:hypothetical protein [Sodalinema gerasimenkoae]|uniref:hypothetical protein n=1 Tax=Sodalinema gerasimenkoae TaxID=2862348 RepID=UPI0013596D6E|nr:hypothetical protein [Sodalinema gerasimenkoae]